MATLKAFLRKVAPGALRSLPWRLRWVVSTDAFAKAPIRTVAKLLRWSMLELLGRDAKFVTAEGVTMRSMAANFTSLNVYITGKRDDEIQAFIARHLKPGDSFIDVGANVGVYTLFASRLVGHAGRVVAIEANPPTFRYLNDNIAGSGATNVMALNFAVGEKAGSIAMAANQANAGETHVATAGEIGARIPMDTLDNLLGAQRLERVAYIKIDVEGFELPVLRGAVDTLRRSGEIAVQTEINAAHARRYGYPISAMVELMRGAGFSPHRCGKDGRLLAISAAEIMLQSDVIWRR